MALNPTVLSYLCPAFELKSQKNTKHTVLYLRDTYSSDKVCWKLMRWMSHNPAQIPKYIVPAVIQQTPDGWIKSFISYIIIRCGISVCRFSLLSVDMWTCFWIYRRACGCEGGTCIYISASRMLLSNALFILCSVCCYYIRVQYCEACVSFPPYFISHTVTNFYENTGNCSLIV